MPRTRFPGRAPTAPARAAYTSRGTPSTTAPATNGHTDHSLTTSSASCNTVPALNPIISSAAMKPPFQSGEHTT